MTRLTAVLIPAIFLKIRDLIEFYMMDNPAHA